MTLATLREMTEAITTVEQRPDTERVFMQLKGAAQRGLLKHKDTHGPKGAMRFPLVEVALARVLMRALDSGMSGEDMKVFADALRVEARRALPNGEHVILSLAEAVQTIREKRWTLEIVQSRDEEGTQAASILWLPNGVRFGHPDPMDPDVFIPGRVIEEIRFIPFTTLVRPILDHLIAKSGA